MTDRNIKCDVEDGVVTCEVDDNNIPLHNNHVEELREDLRSDDGKHDPLPHDTCASLNESFLEDLDEKKQSTVYNRYLYLSMYVGGCPIPKLETEESG